MENNTPGLLARLLEQGVAGIFAYVRDGACSLVSFDNTAPLILGVGPERLPLDLESLLTGHPANQVFRDHCLVSGITGPEQNRFVIHIRGAGGKNRWLELSETRSPSHPSLIEGIAIDVTELAQAKEDMAASSKAKDEFLANMSHEVRTPLNVIMGMTELTLGTSLDATQREYLDAVRGASEHMLALVNDYLDLARIESGALALDVDDFDLHELMASTVKTMEFQTRLRDLKLVLTIDSRVPAMIRGDARRLRQVFMNLLGNGCKFTRHGQISLSVEPEQVQDGEEGIRLHFCVRDTGPGIAPEDADRIFSKYAQAGTDDKESHLRGAGLGLAISRSLVERMGGRIWLESAPGSGSAFHFTPCFQEARSQLPEEEGGGATEAAGRPLSILVAEDFEPNRTMISAMFQSRGHQASCVGDGAEALEAIRNGSFDLALMDLHMPVMDGFTAVEHIRRLEQAEGRRRIPIIALTADTFGADREKCVQAGMDDYLSKPISARRLFTMVEDIAARTMCDDSAGQEPVVDFSYALNMMDGQSDVLMVTLLAVIGNFPIRMLELDEAAAASEWQVVSRLAHSMKSTLLNIGANQAGEQARELELLAGEGDGHAVTDRLPAFKQALDQVIQAVESYIQGR